MLVSAVQQSEPALYVHISPPSWASLQPLTSHPFRSSQNTELSFWCSLFNGHQYFFLALYFMALHDILDLSSYLILQVLGMNCGRFHWEMVANSCYGIRSYGISIGVSLPSQMAEQGTICMLTNLCGLPWWLSGEKSVCQYRRCGLNPWIRNIPWRRKWQLTSVFLPGKSLGRSSLLGYSPWGCKESDTTEWLHFHFSN